MGFLQSWSWACCLVLLLLTPKLLASECSTKPQPESGFGVSIGSGYGLRHLLPIRVGVQKDFGKTWDTVCLWPLGGYFEASYYYLRSTKHLYTCQKFYLDRSHKSLSVLAIAAVFRLEREDPMNSCEVWPFVELGIGLSGYNRKEVVGRELGKRFGFEDRLGLGIRFGKNREFDFSYRFIHFSNAHIGSQNHGINLHLFVLGYWFD